MKNKQGAVQLKSVNDQQGRNLFAFLLILASMLVAALLVFNVFIDRSFEQKMDFASQEIELLVREISQWRINNNDYSGISISAMYTAGYDLGDISSGSSDNAFGLNTTIFSTNGAEHTKLIYQTSASDECVGLIERVGNLSEFRGTSTCSGSGPYELTLAID